MMKNIISHMKTAAGLCFALSLCFVSCKKDNEKGVEAAPVITRIRTVSKSTADSITKLVTLDSSANYAHTTVVAFDSTTTTGKLNTQYAIIGENLLKTTQVIVNGVAIYFNPALLTDKSIIFTLPATAPWGASQENKIRVVTNYGSTDFGFNVQQPAPTITSLNPVAAGAGETITITGLVFDGVTSVRFDTKEATIVSSTATEIKVKVPEGIVQAYVYVTTPGGTSKSPSAFGFKKIIFDDALDAGFSVYGGWGGTIDIANTTIVKRGTRSIKISYTGGYGSPLQFGYTGATLTLSNYTAVKISIYGGAGTEGKSVKLVFNGADGYLITLHQGVWTDYTIPLSSISSAATLNEIWLQEFSGNTPSEVYVDDFGLI